MDSLDGNPRLIFFNEKGQEIETLDVSKMDGPEICNLLERRGFMKRKADVKIDMGLDSGDSLDPNEQYVDDDELEEDFYQDYYEEQEYPSEDSYNMYTDL